MFYYWWISMCAELKKRTRIQGAPIEFCAFLNLRGWFGPKEDTENSRNVLDVIYRSSQKQNINLS